MKFYSIIFCAAILAGCGGGSTETPNTGGGTTTANLTTIPNIASDADWPPPPSLRTTDCSVALTGKHSTINVGPGKQYTELTNVPWLTLQAGDVVNVYYRDTPYKTKIGLRVKTSRDNPFILNGVTNAECARPEISGQDAVLATDTINSNFGDGIQMLSLILINRGSTDSNESYKANSIIIQNLKLTGAREGYFYKDKSGVSQAYNPFAAAIYTRRVDELVIENCEITNNGHAVFTNTVGQSLADFSSYIYIRNNKIYGNGANGAETIHNLYIQGKRVLYEGNYLGQLRVGATGSTLKDRSSGTVIRYNYISANARAIDLVETEEEEVKTIQSDPLYKNAWVYGNIIETSSKNTNYAVLPIHWGYDNDASKSRNGILYFYNNTFVSDVPQTTTWYTTVFHIGRDATPVGKVYLQNNIIENLNTSEFRFMADTGVATFFGKNYVQKNWWPVCDICGHPAIVNQNIGLIKDKDSASLISTTYHLNSNSVAVDAGSLPITFDNKLADNLQPNYQYSGAGRITERKMKGNSWDLGAFEDF